MTTGSVVAMGDRRCEVMPERDVSGVPAGPEQFDPGRRVDEDHRGDAR